MGKEAEGIPGVSRVTRCDSDALDQRVEIHRLSREVVTGKVSTSV